MFLLSALFAVLAAASNATGTAFQRKAASTVPSGGGLGLLRRLAHRPAWYVGITGLTGAALFQALALANGPLSLVQPVFVLELPFALLIGFPLLHRQLPAQGWWAIAAVVTGLAVVLAAADPSGTRDQAPMTRWVPALAACLGAMALAVLPALRTRSGLLKAACLGAGSAVGNAVTAAQLKSATGTLQEDGLVAFFETWQTYGFVATGITAVLLLENALQAGSLAASQPALTIGDAGISLVLGITLFDESVRAGWWLLPELAGVALIVWGIQELTRAVPHISDLAG